jgi:hypothetical protein
VRNAIETLCNIGLACWQFARSVMKNLKRRNKKMKKKIKDKRARQFIKSLGSGKNIYQIESEEAEFEDKDEKEKDS